MGGTREYDTKPGLVALLGLQGLRWNADHPDATLTGGELAATTDGGPRTDVAEADGAQFSYWSNGGCGAFAAAMADRWPHLKIAVEMYDDGGDDMVSHCWAYDGTHKFDIFGAQEWEPSERPWGYRTDRVILDQSPEQVDDLFFSSSANLGAMIEALDVIEDMFGEPGICTADGDRVTLASLAERWPEFGTAEGADNQCEGASIDVAKLLGGDIVRCTGMRSDPVRNPNGASAAAIEHYAVLIDGKIVDVTARQFDPSAPFPLVLDVGEYVDGWQDVERYDAELDDWVPYA